MKNPDEFKSKKEALEYCLEVCTSRQNHSAYPRGCAFDCPIRKHWAIPPHGKSFL